MSFAYSSDLALAAAVVDTLTAVEAELGELAADQSRRMSLLPAAWTGQAASAHLEAHARWEAGYGDMRTALADMREVVRTAKENYEAAVSVNAQLWRAVQ